MMPYDGQDDVAELTRGQQVDDPLLNAARLNVKARRDDAALLTRPIRSTILPARWSSTTSNSLVLACFIICWGI